MKKRKISLIICFILAASTVFAHEYVVDLTGDDHHPGTRELPFRSIQSASEVALPGDTVTVRGGEYTLHQPFKPVRSGLPAQWIIYRAAPNEKVIFDGSLIVKVLQKGDSVKLTRLTHGIFQIEKGELYPF